jgi:glycosyl transferase family 87
MANVPAVEKILAMRSPRSAEWSSPERLSRVLLGATALLLLLFCWVTLYRAGPYRVGSWQWGSPVHRTDFSVYRNAGAAVLQGADIYEVRNLRGWAYVYPPPFAIAMVPLALLPMPISVFVWYCLSVALAAWAVSMSRRLAQTSELTPKSKLALTAIPAFLVAVWFAVGFERGQASVLMAWLVIAAIFWEREGRLAAGAACLAGAILLKTFALPLLAYYAWRRKWKFVAATLIALAIGTLVLPGAVFGWHRNLYYLNEWKQNVVVPALASETMRAHSDLYDQLLDLSLPRNQSLAPVLYRLSGEQQMPALGVGLAAVMALIIWLVGRRPRPHAERLILGAVVVWMLLISPVAEDHYFAILLLPLAYATAELMARPKSRLTNWGYGCLAVYGILNLACVLDRRFEIYGAVGWTAVMLWVLLLYLARSSARQCSSAVQGGT